MSSAIQVTWLREVRAFRAAFSCGVPVAAFLAVCGWTFVVTLRNNEGSVLQLQSIWGLSVAPWLPILSAVLTMRLFAEERSTGMIDLLMSAPVRERELVLGKFLSAMTVIAATLALSLAVPLLLPALSAPLHGTVRATAFAATFLILLLQGAAWCAAGTMVSVLFRNQAAAAVSSLVLCSGVPIAVYAAVLAWLPGTRAEVAWMPLLVHVYDFSTGLFSTSVVALYLATMLFFLFACSKLLALLRVNGLLLRASTLLAVALGAALALLAAVLARRHEVVWEVSVGQVTQVSARTRDLLADTQGSIRVTCLMDRRHPMFRPVSRLLRGIQHASRGVAGADIAVQYVDPRWDIVKAGQLAAQGVPENALLFERQRRKLVVTLDEMLAPRSLLRSREEAQAARNHELGVFRGESVCAAALARLALPFERASVYWLQGHGEARFDDYDELHGFSDIARELRRSGFDLKPLALPGLSRIPEECQVLVIAGARYALTAEELNLLDAFLQNGGRLLYLCAPRAATGAEGVLAKWGIELKPFFAASPQTLSGHEVVITAFSDHTVTRDLKNASLVFGYAVCVGARAEPASAAGAAADRPSVTLLAQTDGAGWGESMPDVFPRRFDARADLPGPVAVAAASERGGTVARDVAFRPTRVCVIGETDFVMNGTLAARANANRDFFMNAVAWLAGVDMGSAPSLGGDATLVTGFARRDWVLFMAGAAGAVPFCAFLIFCVFARRRR